MPGAVLSLFDVLVAEYEAQGTQPPFPREDFEARRRQGEPDSALIADFYSWLHANGVRRSALCFSGGGIRSATFGLGVIQGLARAGLLKRFDFLSTVSGG
ncbi:MAG TPA: hypothetical protein VLR69_19125, partial [Thermoanaerobaculia bacterium]|nr:hypothetical protein [Thermoanaerobaculia bacterium]